MDITNYIVNTATEMTQQSMAQTANALVLKTALKAEASVVAQLISTIPSVSANNLPENIGQNINTQV